MLWTLVLIAFLVAHLTASGRTEVRIAGNLVDNAVAEAAADGAISQAIFKLSDPRPDQRWRLDGALRQVAIGNSRVALQLEDEAGRINPNLASADLLEALLQIVGGDPQRTGRLALAIGEWVGSAQAAQDPAAMVAQYRAAGLDYRPPGEPLESLDELGRVVGMTPAVLAALRPHLTLYGPAEPNPNSPDPVVAAALARLPHTGNASSPADQQTPDLQTVRIIATAQGPGNARVSRTAIVQIGTMLPAGYNVLAWRSRID
ncbi:MAG TPA: hypothetical protein VGF34_12505 [Stellaceae bacterium]